MGLLARALGLSGSQSLSSLFGETASVPSVSFMSITPFTERLSQTCALHLTSEAHSGPFLNTAAEAWAILVTCLGSGQVAELTLKLCFAIPLSLNIQTTHGAHRSLCMSSGAR